MVIDNLVSPVDKPIKIGQGFHAGKRTGPSTHKPIPGIGDDSFALDYLVDVGSTVYAAREGTVLAIMNDRDPLPPKETYTLDEVMALGDQVLGNYVVIEHEDGTRSLYAHLMRERESIDVEVGQVVEQKDLIAKSGHTGLSSAPHLHFAIYRIVDGLAISQPIAFKDYDGPLEDGVLHPELCH